eukprot:6724817-Prymnesium_polylepis.1
MEAEHMPHQILQRLLNLAEFMERGDKPLGIRWDKLGKLSSTAHAYAKALHYKEIVFESALPSSTTIEALITINKDLQQFDSARGILEYAARALTRQAPRMRHAPSLRWQAPRLHGRHPPSCSCGARAVRIAGTRSTSTPSSSSSRGTSCCRTGRRRCRPTTRSRPSATSMTTRTS